MSQKAYCLLSSMKHRVMIEQYTNEGLVERTRRLNPHLIICPFLTRPVPDEIYRDYITLIVHPGPVGDRGRHSVDRWIFTRPKQWGVTILEADHEMDAGPVWAEEKIDTDEHLSRTATKSDAYDLLTTVAMKGLKGIFESLQMGKYPGIHQPDSVKNTPLNTLKQSDCKINWASDPAETIIKKIQARDSQPGILDSINETPVYLYGSRIQALKQLNTNPPKTILSQDKQALLLSCADPKYAIWISCLKSAVHTKYPFKLPATQVICPMKMSSLDYPSYQDIWINVRDRVCYVEWEFYNGAMRDDQCIRLKEALENYVDDSIKVIVLLGGHRHFSNGIDLNTIEASEDSVAQSHKYINAINNLIQSLMMNMSNKIIISVLRGHAGAGGAMMSQAADFVYIHENSIINPHYKTMGLFGSEYWTFNLPSRLGSKSQAHALVDSQMPLDAQRAVSSGFADLSFSTFRQIDEIVRKEILPNFDDLLAKKIRRMAENIGKFGHPESCRQKEMLVMSENFQSHEYKQARYNFVRKVVPKMTPFHLLRLNRQQPMLMTGQTCADHILYQIKSKHNLGCTTPTLGCLLIGSRQDSHLYVRMKKETFVEKLNFRTEIVHINSTHENDISFEKLQSIIEKWNQDSNINGILIQLPLPRYIQKYESALIQLISPEKDVDGLLYPKSSFTPCAAQGILSLFDWYDVKLSGKNVTVVGGSKLVGEPVSLMCKARGATVTICSVQTKNLRESLRYADIIISAVGSPNLIHGGLLSSNRSYIIVDAGVSYQGGKYYGDVDFESVKDKCTLISPRKGAVGKLTIAMLAQNLSNAYLLQNKKI